MKKYLIAYSIFRLLDILTTTVGVGYLGCWESNPLMRALIGLGIWQFVFMNVTVSFLVGLYLKHNFKNRAVRLGFLGFIILNGIIVVGNIVAISIALYINYIS